MPEKLFYTPVNRRRQTIRDAILASRRQVPFPPGGP